MFTTFEQQHNYYLEPPEPKIFAYDWRGDEIYYGDRYYEYDGDYILEDDLECYVKTELISKYGRLVSFYIFENEEDEPYLLPYDWRGNKIHSNDSYYYLYGDYILENDLEEYAKEVLVSEIRVAEEQLC